MTILGINAYHADSSAAILVDGRLVAAAEEERFTRIKHWAGFPAKAISFCLQETGIDLAQVDHIAVGRDPGAKLGKKLLYLLKNPAGGFGTVISRVQNSGKILSLQKELARITGTDESVIQSKIHRVEHHRSHLASAFFASPFKEAALLSIDGSGDFTTTMTGVGIGNKITVINSIDFPVSAGTFYTAFTQFLGFSHYGDEYKVMGLSSYGVPRYVDKLRDIIQFRGDGMFTWNSRYFRSARDVAVTYSKEHIPFSGPLYTGYLEEQFGRARAKGEALTQYHKDLAASVQQFTEELIFHIVNHLQALTGYKDLCFAGGVAQNSVANGKILQNSRFENLYIPPAAHDAGISIGAALYVYNQTLDQPRGAALYGAYTGSKFSNAEIETYLQSCRISYSRYTDEELYEKVVSSLVNSGVIGWFQGRAEFGPRALGMRSILVDPRRDDAKELLNNKIKRRESFRPFAPSILKEYVPEYFEYTGESPFMEKVFPIKKEKRSIIPAVTHVDGTGRLQTVDKNVSPRYYRLIDAFRKKTGVPILLNTSFNENEPIVNSPAEALDCFIRTKMDMLVMENCVVER